MKKYQAICPDGAVLTRRTDRTYSHVLAIKNTAGSYSAYGWIGRPDLIQAKLREAERVGYTRDKMEVVPVSEVPKG